MSLLLFKDARENPTHEMMGALFISRLVDVFVSSSIFQAASLPASDNQDVGEKMQVIDNLVELFGTNIEDLEKKTEFVRKLPDKMKLPLK